MSTLRVSNIEAKADPSSPSVDEKLKFTNSNGDVLFHLDGKTSGITTVGVNTTSATFSVDNNQNVEFLGIVTATKFSLSGGGEITGGDANFTGIVTAGSISVTGNVSVGGTLTYEDVTSIDSIGIITARGDVHVGAGLSVVGVSTLGNTIVGGATTELIVGGDARITGILTIGTSSITLDGTTNQVNVGSGVTIHHTNGIQVGENILHSSGLTINSFLGTPELAGISSSISDTAVDIFIYDTSKDSDGGAWRHRTTHTSWYNETLNTATRGSRREFPAVAVIVSTLDKVTIYDGDDPDMPMWMVFEGQSGGNTVDSKMLQYSYTNGYYVHALNGILVIGQKSNGDNYGSPIIRFISEYVNRMDANDFEGGVWNGNIADRNSTVGYRVSASETYIIVNSIINDIAMTVLPNAPIDSATGLPVPTIAVATEGGVSVIKDDGTVVDGTSTSGSNYSQTKRITITEEKYLWWLADYNNGGQYLRDSFALSLNTIPSSDFTWDNASDNLSTGTYYAVTTGNEGGEIKIGSVNTWAWNKQERNALGGPAGLAIHKPNIGSETNSLIVGITSSYNTGWQHGAIKGAFLSDTDATNVTGTTTYSDSFDNNNNGWTFADNGSSGISGGVMTIEQNGSARATDSDALNGVATGTKLSVTFTIATGGTGTLLLDDDGAGAGVGGNVTIITATSTGTFSAIYTKTASNRLRFIRSSGTGNYTISEIIIKPIQEEDRSVNNKGLAVYGTVTKSAVATGAELVAYSGWSSSNYLRHRSSTNYGSSATISFMAWQKTSDTSNYQYAASVWDSTSNKEVGISIGSNTSGYSGVPYIYDGTNSVLQGGGVSIADGNWHFVVGILNGTTRSIYVDGILRNSATCTAVNLAAVNYTNVGHYTNDGSVLLSHLGSLALVRITASAPSPEQIKKIYEDEKVLFQENAACTLYGSSDAVTALAYDEVNDLLHVGTSSGRSEFQGLRRINNTTTAVTTAISAYDSFVVEQ